MVDGTDFSPLCTISTIFSFKLYLCRDGQQEILRRSGAVLQVSVRRELTLNQGVQRPGNVREFRCKEKKLGKVKEFSKNKKSQGILLCEIHFQPI